MIYLFLDLILASFTNISSYFLILSWFKKDIFTFLTEGLILSIIFHNWFYLLILFFLYLINKYLKIPLSNYLNFLVYFSFNYFLFNLLIYLMTRGFTPNLLLNYFYNLLLTYFGYKLSLPYIKLNR